MDDEQGPSDDSWESALFARPAAGIDQSSADSPVSQWTPSRGPGQQVGIALSALCFVATCVAVYLLANSIGLVRVFWIVAAVDGIAATTVLLVMLVRLRSITYLLTSGQFVVRRTGAQIVVRFDDIVGVVFQPRDVIASRGYERYWPGFYDSTIATERGPWQSIATVPANERVRIQTRQGGTIAISPDRPVLFVETLDAMRESRAISIPTGYEGDKLQAGSAARSPVEVEQILSPRGSVSGEPQPAEPGTTNERSAIHVFRTRIVRGDLAASRLLALNILLLIASLFIAAWKSDSVTRPVAIRWDPSGEPTWYVRPDGFWLIDGIWIFPITAAAVLAINAALATLVAAFGRTLEVRLFLSTALVVGFLLLIAMSKATGLI